jgi:hypothetical protein
MGADPAVLDRPPVTAPDPDASPNASVPDPMDLPRTRGNGPVRASAVRQSQRDAGNRRTTEVLARLDDAHTESTAVLRGPGGAEARMRGRTEAVSASGAGAVSRAAHDSHRTGPAPSPTEAHREHGARSASPAARRAVHGTNRGARSATPGGGASPGASLPAAPARPLDIAREGPERPEGAPLPPGYDPIEARAEVQAMVEELRGRARERRALSQVETTALAAAIRIGAAARKIEVAAATGSATAAFRTQVSQTRTQVHGQTRAAQTTITQTIAGAKSGITAQAEEKIAEVTRSATERKQALRDGARIKKNEARQMGATESDRGATRNEADAATARQRGRDKAATYPQDERGRAQADAVIATANRVGREIAHNTHEMRSFARESAAEASKGFDQTAADAISQIDQHLPDVSGPIHDISTSAQGSLDGVQRDGLTQLGQIDSEADESLTTLETATVRQFSDIAARVSAEIDTAAASAISGARAQLVSLDLQVDSQADMAATFLLGITEPDVASARDVIDQMTAFVANAGGILGNGLAEYERDVVVAFGTAATGAETAIGATRQQATAGLGTLHGGVTTAIGGVTAGVRTQCAQATAQAAQAETEIVQSIIRQLDDGVRQTVAGFSALIARAQPQIRAKIEEGLSKNTEALAGLDQSMTDAASKAAWDVDNKGWAIARDIGLFVLAFVVAVLVVILIVVVIIIIAKVAIAGLIALGCAALVAKIIVVVALLAVAGYMIYRSYSARRARIEHEEGSESRGMTFLRSAGEMFGLTQVAEGFTEEGLTPFERGWKIGEGVATLASWFLGGKISGRIDAAIPTIRWVPNWVRNPVRGSAIRWIEGRFGGGGAAEVPRFEPLPISGEGAGELPRFEPARDPARTGAPPAADTPRVEAPVQQPPAPDPVAAPDPIATPRRPDLQLIQGEGGGTPPQRVPQAAPVAVDVPHVKVAGGEPIPLEPTPRGVNDPIGIRQGEAPQAMAGEPPRGSGGGRGGRGGKGGGERPPGGGGRGGGRRPPGGGEPPGSGGPPRGGDRPRLTLVPEPTEPEPLHLMEPANDNGLPRLPEGKPVIDPRTGQVTNPRRLVVGASPNGTHGPIPDPEGYDTEFMDIRKKSDAQHQMKITEASPSDIGGTFDEIYFERMSEIKGGGLDAEAVSSAHGLLKPGGHLRILARLGNRSQQDVVDSIMGMVNPSEFTAVSTTPFRSGGPHVLIELVRIP